MRVLLFFMLFQVSGTLPAQTGTEMSFPYKDIVFSVTEAFGNSFGSAFIVGKNDQYFFLATAKHVVQDDRQLLLTSSEGVQYPAVLVKAHSIHDIALLQMPIFPLDLDSIPMVSNLSMNDEVTFVSVKDSGRILPSKSPGIVRDINGESLSVIMKEVESGHSGSPLLSNAGIAGMITRNGKFIENLNIVLVKDILDEWGEGVFEKLLALGHISREKLEAPKTSIGQSTKLLSSKSVSNPQTQTGIRALTDGKLDTYEKYTVPEMKTADMLIEFDGIVSVSYFRIFISNQVGGLLPEGYVYLTYNGQSIYSRLSMLLKYREKAENGSWYVYEYLKPILSNTVLFRFKPIGSGDETYYFNEIEFYGNSL